MRPVVASYGGRDRGFRSHGERLREHLRALGVDHDVTIYPEAGHSFMTDGHHPIASLAHLFGSSATRIAVRRH
ncbi:dienelactone hydrolase family protein [Nonomuraea mesophila]|uniref:dienelactone hydrolase family protein n=1 Tax=Nonomuraea mesophila TaxID=2530382 RepID=UPI001408F24D|nr:dienelactone hydrolase family protein [Nonomuraea mesophila]